MVCCWSRRSKIPILRSSLAHSPPAFASSAPFDVVLVGREAGDWGAGQTGGLLAEELGLPCIAFAESFAPAAAGQVQVKRQTDNGWEQYEAASPLVITVTNHDKNVPRIPKTRDVMQSYRKPLDEVAVV